MTLLTITSFQRGALPKLQLPAHHSPSSFTHGAAIVYVSPIPIETDLQFQRAFSASFDRLASEATYCEPIDSEC